MRSGSLTELARYGFVDLSATVAKLDRLVELVGDAGRATLDPLSRTASPDAALDALIRLAEQSSISKILKKPESSERLTRLLGASDGLAEILRRHPMMVSIFTEPSRLPTTAEILELANLEPIGEGDRDRIRVGYRKLLMRIADYDLSKSGYLDQIAEVTAALSDIAGAALDAALRLARFEMTAEGKYSQAEVDDTRLAIIGMGKCGARELNYVSDVDVIFVVEGDHERLIELGTRLATRTMRLLDENSQEPMLWQVDANLRPEGKSGALVRTLDSHVSYYERWAENWEFQALLKARAIAGDRALGAAYIERVTPLIWARPNRSELVDGVRKMRARVLENIPAAERDREVKLGSGGLRDVEFTVQLLQLVHGVADASVRVPDTLGALSALSQSGFIGRGDASTFSELYQSLRAIEHRIQLLTLRRDHLIPLAESAQRRVARGLDPKFGAAELLILFAQLRSKVQSLSDSVFYRPLLNAVADLSAGEIRLSDDEVSQRLEALGFTDASGAQRHIQALTEGVSRRAAIQRNLLPVLLRWLAEGESPDRGLLSFRRLSEALGESHWFLRMLRDNTGAAQRLMHALSSSALVARLLEHIPESTAWFGDESETEPRSQAELLAELTAILHRNDDETAAESIRFVRRREVLRISVAALTGAISHERTTRALSDLTDAYLAAMLDLARRQVGAPVETEFAIIAMGRYGGQEIGFGSDADCMLVYRTVTDDESGDRIAGALQVLVKDQLFAFDLDLDLRPEGKKGPRVRSLSSYQAYYERWADTWEFQALLRARAAIGSESLLADFNRLVDHYRYPQTLSSLQVTEIRRIKARVETERLPQGADPLRHLKLGRGSISDVEWLLQLLQLQHANRLPALRVIGCEATAIALVSEGLISKDDAEVLMSSWRLANSIRSFANLALDKSQDVLPTDRIQLRAIATVMGYESGSALEQHYLSVSRRSRQVYERLFYPSDSKS